MARRTRTRPTSLTSVGAWFRDGTGRDGLAGDGRAGAREARCRGGSPAAGWRVGRRLEGLIRRQRRQSPASPLRVELHEQRLDPDGGHVGRGMDQGGRVLAVVVIEMGAGTMGDPPLSDSRTARIERSFMPCSAASLASPMACSNRSSVRTGVLGRAAGPWGRGEAGVGTGTGTDAPARIASRREAQGPRRACDRPGRSPESPFPEHRQGPEVVELATGRLERRGGQAVANLAVESWPPQALATSQRPSLLAASARCRALALAPSERASSGSRRPGDRAGSWRGGWRRNPARLPRMRQGQGDLDLHVAWPGLGQRLQIGADLRQQIGPFRGQFEGRSEQAGHDHPIDVSGVDHEHEVGGRSPPGLTRV